MACGKKEREESLHLYILYSFLLLRSETTLMSKQDDIFPVSNFKHCIVPFFPLTKCQILVKVVFFLSLSKIVPPHPKCLTHSRNLHYNLHYMMSYFLYLRKIGLAPTTFRLRTMYSTKNLRLITTKSHASKLRSKKGTAKLFCLYWLKKIGESG